MVLSSLIATGIVVGTFGLTASAWAQSATASGGPNYITGPSGLQCTIDAQTPHFSQWWYDNYDQYKVDTKGDGSCSESANELQAQATLYYAAYIGTAGYWISATPSPKATVYGKSGITTKQSNTSCQYLTTNQYYGTAVLWINGGPAQDSPINGPVDVPCQPSRYA
ncbi:MAG: hypothetical protein OWR62_14880 [Sulfobacillus thermotolerans]|nr:hypothetical protein [Sulfobacillus thermotolerans]